MEFIPQSGYYHARESCYLCGRTDSLVDTGVTIVGEGVLALCVGCIRGDLCRAAGIDVDALEAAAGAADALQVDLACARKQLAKARATIRALKKPVDEPVAV